MSDSPNPAPLPQPVADSRPKKRFRWLKRGCIFSGILLFLVSSLAVTAEYYTSQPQFCASCHIMKPYFDSWGKDVHSGNGHAICVDCHYAPGHQHTIDAKFRGLSQLASYFSGRFGAARPRAHINDASCMTSGCHGNLKFMTAELKMGTVTFTHAKHLDPESQMLQKSMSQLQSLRRELHKLLNDKQFTALEEMGRLMQNSSDRNKQIVKWLTDEKLTSIGDKAQTFSDLLHTEVRVKQLAGLKCGSCHQFDASLKNHFTVAKTTCYTCHFMHQPFNAGTGQCLTCHEPPRKMIPVHGAELTSAPNDNPHWTPQIDMDHSTIIANNVNCVSCHADLVRGTGRVNISNCQNCHDQDRFLKDFGHLTTEVVSEYHRVHAAGQHARCNDCHQLIQHELVPVTAIGDVETLLAPVRQDCQHCHPDHHREQVNLLIGQGGFLSNATGVPNPMTGSRINCQACHTESGSDPKGEVVIRSTMESCRQCHSQEYEQLFVHWHEMLDARLAEAEQLLSEIDPKLPVTTQPAGAETRPVDTLIQRARANIKLVRAANGIHNRNYSLMLLDQAIEDLQKAKKLQSK